MLLDIIFKSFGEADNVIEVGEASSPFKTSQDKIHQSLEYLASIARAKGKTLNWNSPSEQEKADPEEDLRTWAYILNIKTGRYCR